ncbi:MAG TPA: UvrD-helicase domain-containing protein [Acidimicrobiales bacterium]|nr:UvrD-helicase domain-containing protein [Acidimicrobiales bacterium]
MPRLPLTDEQNDAVRAGDKRLFIEAAPGAGKTTVAAERYGVLRFTGSERSRLSVTAVSFTRSATSELHRRVRSRWGSSALTWPHSVMTIDMLVCYVVEHLLRSGVIRWPGDHTSLQVLDDWRGHRGYRWLIAGSFRRVAAIDASGVVTSVGRPMGDGGLGIGSRGDFHLHLDAGRCTHEDVRAVLAAALRMPAMREAVVDLLSSSVAHIVVDEVFDANDLDLALVDLACSAGIAVTLVGDPWQALYGFRGAKPERVPAILTKWGFESLPLSHSFRFQSDEMKALSVLLRGGQPVSLSASEGHDVVLASQWGYLWQASDNVLPVSFGRTANKTDAAAIVLLDHLVYSNFNQHAIFLPEALVLLDLDRDTYRSEGPAVLSDVVETLAGSAEDATVKALRALRDAMKQLGAPRRLRASTGENEQRQIDRLTALGARLRSDAPLVPGMTIHQAKGREWDRVGVRLGADELSRLMAGLGQGVESDRALYVALTRARHAVGMVA